jgi:L1 cell adhesion molecule like protein
MRNTLNDEKLREKFTEEDKKLIEELSKEGLQWLEANSMAEPSEIEAE